MVCLDSSVIIDILRGRESVKEIESKLDSNQEEIFIPTPVIMEIIRGINLKETQKNLKQNEKEEIDNLLSSFFILDFDKESAIKAGEIEAELLNNGEMIDLEDIMIGAIALKNNQIIVTRNKKHFEKIEDLNIEGY